MRRLQVRGRLSASRAFHSALVYEAKILEISDVSKGEEKVTVTQ